MPLYFLGGRKCKTLVCSNPSSLAYKRRRDKNERFNQTWQSPSLMDGIHNGLIFFLQNKWCIHTKIFENHRKNRQKTPLKKSRQTRSTRTTNSIPNYFHFGKVISVPRSIELRNWRNISFKCRCIKIICNDNFRNHFTPLCREV